METKDLTFVDILGIEDKSIVRHFVEQWNGNVYIRNMSAKERSEIEDLYMKISESKRDTGKFRKELIRRALVDKEGNSLIADDAMAEHIMGKSALAIESIFEVACEVNGFRQKDVDMLKKK